MESAGVCGCGYVWDSTAKRFTITPLDKIIHLRRFVWLSLDQTALQSLHLCCMWWRNWVGCGPNKVKRNLLLRGVCLLGGTAWSVNSYLWMLSGFSNVAFNSCAVKIVYINIFTMSLNVAHFSRIYSQNYGCMINWKKSKIRIWLCVIIKSQRVWFN